MRRFGMLIVGLLVGGLVGLGLALLFTPKSGDKMRQEAREYYDQLLDEARQAAETRRHELEAELQQATGIDLTPPSKNGGSKLVEV